MVAQVPIVSSTKISWVSTALVLCGEKPLNSLTDPRYGAAVGDALFDLIYENELASDRWHFACVKAALSRVTTAPPNEWQYCFQLPTDMITAIGFYGVGPDRSYEIYGDKIYTNITSNPGVVQGVLTLDYTIKPDPGVCPSYFSLLVIHALTKHMIKPITESDSAMTKAEQAYNLQRARAQYINATQRPNRQLASRPFISVR